ncbi:Ion channel [Aphelenchoides besseyi]|nr:Ion channel [Aphelenchoides besseyi]
MILPLISETNKSFFANLLSLILLFLYAIGGAFMFLFFEADHFEDEIKRIKMQKYECINNVMKSQSIDTASIIVQKCLEDQQTMWTFKAAVLYAIGIMTTLGYGKIQTTTSNGKIFTVVFGLVGVPCCVIILTNFGLYLRRLDKTVRTSWRNRCKSDDKSSIRFSTVSGGTESSTSSGISPIYLACVVCAYLLFGSIFIPILNGKFDFVAGLYDSYICFSAIEFGNLIPERNIFIPIVIVYLCFGLCISTYAVELGSVYVKKLYYASRKAKNFAAVKIWFGSKQLQVNELLSALGQTIGLDAETFSELDLNQLIQNAILVKEGKLDSVPQSYLFLEGIWPPSLVKMIIKDGFGFPEFIDAEKVETMQKKKMTTIVSFPIWMAAGQHAYRHTFQPESDPEDSDEEEKSEINNNTSLEFKFAY